MTDHAAIPIGKIEGSIVTDDGNHALFEFSTDKDEKVAIAVPTDQLPQLMLLASQAMGNAQKILQTDPKMKHIFQTMRWEIGALPGGQHVVLSFRVEGGSELSFQVGKTDAKKMRDALDVVLAHASGLANSDTAKH